MASAAQARLRAVVDEVVSRAGYDLEDLTVVAAGRRRLLRVVIDSDGGVDLDDAAAVSRDISAELDALEATDPMGQAAYTLEVSSPGIGRPISLPRHFRRARGRLLAITTTEGRSLTGRIRTALDTEVELLTGRSGTQSLTVRYDDIAKARVEVEFSAPSPQVLAALDPETAEKLQGDGAAEVDAALDADPDGPSAEPHDDTDDTDDTGLDDDTEPDDTEPDDTDDDDTNTGPDDDTDDDEDHAR